MLLPIFWLVDKSFAPAVCPRYFQPIECRRSGSRSERLEAERVGTEDVDDVAQTLPGPTDMRSHWKWGGNLYSHHVGKCVCEVIGQSALGVRFAHIDEGMFETGRRRPRHG